MGINIYGRTPSHLYDIYSVDNYEQHTQRRTCMRINIFICVSISGDSIGHESGLLGYSDLSCQWRIPGEWTLGLDPPLLVLYRFIVQSISKAHPWEFGTLATPSRFPPGGLQIIYGIVWVEGLSGSDIIISV